MLGAGCGVLDVSFCQLASVPLCSATAAIAHYLSLITSSNYHINLLLLLTRFLLIRIALGESGIHQKKYFPAKDQSLKKSIDMNVRSSYEVSFKWTKPVFMFLVERSWMLVPDAGCFRLRRIEPSCFTSKPEGRNGCATIVRVVLYFNRRVA